MACWIRSSKISLSFSALSLSSRSNECVRTCASLSLVKDFRSSSTWETATAIDSRNRCISDTWLSEWPSSKSSKYSDPVRPFSFLRSAAIVWVASSSSRAVSRCRNFSSPNSLPTLSASSVCRRNQKNIYI
jgi:hypothetical protein